MIQYVWLNSLIEYSVDHYRPFLKNYLVIIFKKTITDEDIKLFLNKYRIKPSKKYYSYLYQANVCEIITQDEDFLDLYVKFDSDKYVFRVFVNHYIEISGNQEQIFPSFL